MLRDARAVALVPTVPVATTSVTSIQIVRFRYWGCLSVLWNSSRRSASCTLAREAGPLILSRESLSRFTSVVIPSVSRYSISLLTTAGDIHIKALSTCVESTSVRVSVSASFFRSVCPSVYCSTSEDRPISGGSLTGVIVTVCIPASVVMDDHSSTSVKRTSRSASVGLRLGLVYAMAARTAPASSGVMVVCCCACAPAAERRTLSVPLATLQDAASANATPLRRLAGTVHSASPSVSTPVHVAPMSVSASSPATYVDASTVAAAEMTCTCAPATVASPDREGATETGDPPSVYAAVVEGCPVDVTSLTLGLIAATV